MWQLARHPPKAALAQDKPQGRTGDPANLLKSGSHEIDLDQKRSEIT
jgi:hypothetical protein